MAEKKLTLDEINESVIEGWKAKYPNVFAYSTPDGKKAYFRSPTILEIEASTTIASNGKPVQSNKVMATACFLGGDKEVITEDEYVLGISKPLQQLVVRIEGELVQL